MEHCLATVQKQRRDFLKKALDLLVLYDRQQDTGRNARCYTRFGTATLIQRILHSVVYLSVFLIVVISRASAVLRKVNNRAALEGAFCAIKMM